MTCTETDAQPCLPCITSAFSQSGLLDQYGHIEMDMKWPKLRIPPLVNTLICRAQLHSDLVPSFVIKRCAMRIFFLTFSFFNLNIQRNSVGAQSEKEKRERKRETQVKQLHLTIEAPHLKDRAMKHASAASMTVFYKDVYSVFAKFSVCPPKFTKFWCLTACGRVLSSK